MIIIIIINYYYRAKFASWKFQDTNSNEKIHHVDLEPHFDVAWENLKVAHKMNSFSFKSPI